MTGAEPLVAMRGIVRSFGSVQALRGADFFCGNGEIHALLGENGAGKSTLMHVLFGLMEPDAGSIAIGGRSVRFRSAREAMAAGLGMVHQHFTQVPTLTVAENVWLGRRDWRYDEAAARAMVQRVGAKAGLTLDPGALAGSLPVGLRQRLEIVKALARDVSLLILDEPTAALAPAEVDELFVALRALRAAGTGIVLITHKLREVAAIADRVTVLRRGEVVLTGDAAGFDGPALARAMIGGDITAGLAEAVGVVTPATSARSVQERPALRVTDLHVASARGNAGAAESGVSLEVRSGEIVGIAAVEGNGQRELLRAIAGLVPARGTVDASGAIGFVPEDRHREGLVLEFTIAENLALAGTGGRWLSLRDMEADAARLIAQIDIRPPEPRRLAREVSGGNQQKIVLARALAARPAVLVAENPTRGLDVHATADVHQRLRSAARDDGLGVLFHSTDLDEVLALADRIAVMRDGHWTWVPAGIRTREDVGAMMLARSAA